VNVTYLQGEKWILDFVVFGDWTSFDAHKNLVYLSTEKKRAATKLRNLSYFAALGAINLVDVTNCFGIPYTSCCR